MAKMTIDGLTSFVKTYVDASKQAGTWTNSTNNLVGLLDKIGKQITLDGSFQDKLPELDGDNLPLGKTIEEYFIDLTLPVSYVDPSDASFDPASAIKPYFPSVEECSYSYTLGRTIIPTSVKYDDFERACIDSSVAANISGKIMERLANSESLYRFQQKKQMLGNMATKAIAASATYSKLVETLAVPADTATSEAFITELKKDVETASFATEGHSLNGSLIGAAPSLTLFVKKGVMPDIQVQALAGAIHAEQLAIPATIKVVDDFGKIMAADGTTDVSDKVYAMLIDPRGVKLHSGYRALRKNENGAGDYVSFFQHSENTGFISKNTFVKIYKIAD
jgi:hypothetical protein